MPFPSFRLTSLGFSRVVVLEDLISGAEPLSIEQEDIAVGATFRCGPLLTGLALKRAAAAGVPSLPPKLPLVVVRNVELRLVRSIKHGVLSAIEIPALATLALPPILGVSTPDPPMVNLSPSLKCHLQLPGSPNPPICLDMKDVLGTQSAGRRVGDNALLELGSPALDAYGERLWDTEVYLNPVVGKYVEEGEEVQVTEVQFELVFARCVSGGELARLIYTMGQVSRIRRSDSHVGCRAPDATE